MGEWLVLLLNMSTKSKITRLIIAGNFLIFCLLVRTFRFIQFLMVKPFLEGFEARIKIYPSKLIKQPYKSILKNQDQNFDVTFSVI
jgi:hypothetical protein